MTYDPDALRQMNDEAQMRIAELSTALSIVTDQRNNIQDSLDAAIKEINAYKQKSDNLFKAQQKVDELLHSYEKRLEL